MAVAFDAVQSTSGTAVTSLTTPAFTISASATAGAIGFSTSAITSGWDVAIGGVSGDLVTVARPSSRARLFSVLAPPSGSQTATASWTTASDAVLGALTVTGGATENPMNSGVTMLTVLAADDPRLSISTNPGDLTVAVAYATQTLSAATQTERWNITAAAGTLGAGSTGPGTAASDLHAWTTASSTVAAIGANFRAPGSVPNGGSHVDDRFRFRPSVFWSMTSTLGTKRAAWPDDACDFGWRDAVTDNRSRML